MTSHRMEVWSESQRGDLRRGQSLALDSGYWVEHLVSVPSQQVFVAACNDLSLRVFSDQKQGMEFLYRADCLGSVVCTCYCKETGELLTGSMGLITFWGFWTTPQTHLGVVRILDWRCSSLDRDSTVSGLVTEMQTATLYALCNRSIRTFDLVGKKEHRSFSGHGQGTLRCVSPDWGQRYIFTGDMTGFVQVWSSDTRSLLREFRAHTGSVSAVLTRRSTRTLLSSSPDGWVKEWSSSGDLLLKLFLDDLGGVRSLLSLGERRVLCHSPSSFSVWGLQDLCVPFNNPGCGMQLLRRVESGPGRAQILAVSQDGIARLICPASGELLAFSWPFLILDQAIGFAFNPGRKELFVASGRPEVLVLDTALCPCPAKQIIQTAKDQNVDDSVLCLEAVMVGGASPQLCLVFSGLSNGKLQLLSPNRLHCPARKAHDGAVLGMSSLSGPRTQLCCYGSDKQLSVWEVEVGEAHVEVVPLARVCCSSGLVLFRLLSGLVFAVSPDYSLLFFSLPDGACFRTNRNPPTSISCIDCNATLGLVVVSGPGGTVELWETRGVQLAEIRLGRAVSQVCFANARGDLMVCFGSQIYIISGLRFLPARLLQRILDLAPPDDILQDPLPFRPHSQSCYDISNIPQQFLKPGLATPGLTEAPVAVEDLTLDSDNVLVMLDKEPRKKSLLNTAPAPHSVKRDQLVVDAEVNLEEEPMEGARYCQTVKCQTSVEPPRLNALVNWPVAPDGFLPNSILRNWKPGQEPPEAILPNVAKALLRTFCQSEEELSQVSLILDKAKEARLNKPIAMPKLFDTPPEEEENISGKGNEVLKSIAESLWLVYRPDVDLAEVVKALMLSMESTDSDVYLNCTEALLVLFQTYDIPPAVMRNVNVCLLKHIQKGNPCGKRLGGMKILNQLGLLQDKDLHLLVEVILDPAMELRKTVKYLLSHVYGIENKTTLLSRIQASEDPPKKLLNQLDENLSEDLELNSSKDASTVQRRPRPRRGSGPYLEFTGSVKDISIPKQDQMSAPDIPLMRSLRHPKESPISKEELGPVHPHNNFKLHRRLPNPFQRLSLSIVTQDSFKELSEDTQVQVYDPTLMDLYKKSKACKQSCSQLPTIKAPMVSGVSSVEVGRQASLVQLPAGPQCFRLEPVKGMGDFDWKESLNKLVTIHGFRSPGTIRQAPLGPLAVQCFPRTLPPLQARPTRNLSPGQRVVGKIQFRELSLERRPCLFHHVLPLPWQLNCHTLDPSGACCYGRLEEDWVREPMVPQRQNVKELSLPPITPS
ncbi:WD repeat-containing protein 87 [Esox lucius]|uniref:WD repeat-containing protein 87 n=1 Tax=Esox lucius TaxID=8010 RepID=UPI0014770CC0|nr:WD repeat-containing protein 87 [Esox lucius]